MSFEGDFVRRVGRVENGEGFFLRFMGCEFEEEEDLLDF